ncbi:MAG TPA: GNAT family protein [Mycobacteriales bacterium]
MLALGPLRADLVETYWRWENDPVVMIGYGRQVPESLEARRAGLEQQLHGDQAHFTVYDLVGPEPRPVGLTSLSIDHAGRTAELFICLGAEGRGRGIAVEATRLTLDYGFHVTGLRSIHLTVLAPNEAGIRAYQKAGFRLIGRRRNSGMWAGAICDEVLMDAIPGDLTGPSVVRDLIAGR